MIEKMSLAYFSCKVGERGPIVTKLKVENNPETRTDGRTHKAVSFGYFSP